MKYYLIAGEASGDLHGSNLITAIQRLDNRSEFRCWGGDLMQKQGAQLVKHYRELAFMGFIEVVKNLTTILKNIRLCKEDILQWKPDAIVLIDYPGFNLRIAEFAHQAGFKVFYYISPQVWAWKANRVKKIKKYTNKVFTILPFEKDFYAKHNLQVEFVGHPLLDVIDTFSNSAISSEKPIIALLPGSRKQEIQKVLPVMLQTTDAFPEYRFIIAGAPSIPPDFYRQMIKSKDVELLFNQTYSIIASSKAALVTSGTATLETAIIGTPQVVCYKANSLSYHIAKRLIKVRFISLVNLIMDREIVKELIQHDLNSKNLSFELRKILQPEISTQIKVDYNQLKNKLGGPGASDKTAEYIVNVLNKIKE